MIGTTKLSTIREELRRRLAPPGQDPVAWLEEQIRLARQKDEPSKGELQILEAWLDVFKSPDGKERPHNPSGQAPPADVVFEELEAFARDLESAGRRKHSAKTKQLRPRSAQP